MEIKEWTAMSKEERKAYFDKEHAREDARHKEEMERIRKLI